MGKLLLILLNTSALGHTVVFFNYSSFSFRALDEGGGLGMVLESDVMWRESGTPGWPSWLGDCLHLGS